MKKIIILLLPLVVFFASNNNTYSNIFSKKKDISKCKKCRKNKEKRLGKKNRQCEICQKFICKKHHDNDLSKVSNIGGVVCDLCFIRIRPEDTHSIQDKLNVLRDLVSLYAHLNEKLQQFPDLPDHLRKDANLIKNNLYGKNISDVISESLGFIGATLGIAGGAIILAIPSAQLAAPIFIASGATSMSRFVLKSSSEFAVKRLNKVESLKHVTLVNIHIYLAQNIYTLSYQILKDFLQHEDSHLLNQRAKERPHIFQRIMAISIDLLIQMEQTGIKVSNTDLHNKDYIDEAFNYGKQFGMVVGHVADAFDETSTLRKVAKAVPNLTKGKNGIKLTNDIFTTTDDAVLSANKYALSSAIIASSSIGIIFSVLSIAHSSYNLYNVSREIYLGNRSSLSELLKIIADSIKRLPKAEQLMNNFNNIENIYYELIEVDKG